MYKFSVFIVLLVLSSCNSTEPHEIKSLFNIDCSDLCADTNSFLTTHRIDVQCGGSFLPLRNRILTEEELEFSQRNSAEVKEFNENVIIENLNNGAWIKLLKADTLGFHYVQVIDRTNEDELDDQRGVKGFIISRYCGLPTIRQIQNVIVPHFSRTEKADIMMDFLDYHIPKGETLAHAFSYVSNEADEIQVFSFDVNGLNSIQYKLRVVWGQDASVFQEGVAMLIKTYTDTSGKLFSVFSCEPILGYRSELHMCLSENVAFIRYLDTELKELYNSSTTPVPKEHAMNRFK